MTPLEYADVLLRRLQAAEPTVPEPRVTGMGAAVISCQETRVSFIAATLVPDEANPLACDVYQLGTYAVTIARTCANTSKQDGTEDYDALAIVSTQADADVQALSSFFAALTDEDPAANLIDSSALAGAWRTRSGTVSVTISGALLITALDLTCGIP